MPKINENQLKNYITELRTERFGRPFGRNDQRAGASTHTEETMQRGILAETAGASKRALQVLNTIGTQLPRYRGALLELFTYSPTFNEMMSPEYDPCSDRPTQWTYTLVNSFISKLSALCCLYHQTITRQQAGISYLSTTLLNSSDRRLLPLLQRRLLILRKELLPFSQQLQGQLNQFNSAIRTSYEAKRHNHGIDRLGLLQVINNVNSTWEELCKMGKVKAINLS
jgi:hypothetical protein